jgi:uncharacterized protein (DUF2147 family)
VLWNSFCKRHKAGRITCVAFMLFGVADGSLAASADLTPTGVWRTVDDKTGKPRAIIRVYEQNGRWFGKVERSLAPEPRERCDKCTDERKNQPIIGMVVLRNMQKRGDEYAGGDVLDPDNGWVYRCKFRLTDEGKKLDVRGFIGFSLLGRTQTWFREQ